MGSPVGSGAAEAPRNHQGLALTVILACQLMVILDATIVNIALPDIQGDLHFSPTNLAWIVNAYTLAFGGLLLLGGRTGDILGRRKVFTAGIAVFTVASLLGGFATNDTWLLAARALQGVGAAFAAPSTLALLNTNFEGEARTKALSIYSAVSGAGMAFGLIVGGLLTDWLSWRSVLFINVPIGLGILVLAPLYVRQPERHPGRFDIGGALTSTLGMGSLVYGFIRASEDGWGDGGTLGSFAAAVVLLAAFLVIETRAEQPITPLKLLLHRNRASAYTNMLLLPATMFALFFFLTQFLQNVLDYNAVQTGFAFLPMALTQFGMARLSPKLLPKFGPKPLLVTGGVLVTAGIVWLTQIDAGSSYAAAVVGPMLLFGTGSGLSFLPLNMIILSEVKPQDAGAASGLLQAMQQIGATLGLAILVNLFETARKDATPPAGSSADQAAHHVLSEGIASAAVGGAAFAIAALLISLFAVKMPKPPAKPAA
ncbi:transmembrane efflux protein [Streptomyces albus]|uniref:Transmembrane efflux protein n=1 Tax=Streptomyces albus (strain ATCC 21838 / DSM 41398 / FERM P-419 / JCM 4703 / NBRC 107858) TaxID=1081613 RepID=A0A0B5EW86_STRA4|nr:transmembrane efflux protein [Streptomyces albus]AOU76658.1 transmembrane efflux protein [Streptomyces albus]AYN32440.1 transmembrane efflux protein [Streptomyces albus]